MRLSDGMVVKGCCEEIFRRERNVELGEEGD